MLQQHSPARREWRLGWPSVCAGLIGAAASQIHFASLGVFIQPISESMGWSSSVITFGIFMCAVAAVPGSPFAGWLAHRFGLNRILLIGLPTFLGSFALLGWLSHDQTQWIIGWALVALAGVLVKANLWMLWVAQKFDAARGMAFAMIMAGAGVLAIFVPILTQLSIEAFGWRATFPILAGVLALVSVAACIYGFRTCPPEPAVRKSQPGETDGGSDGLLMQDTLRQRSFWQIVLIAFLIGAGLVSVQVHLVPMYAEKGMDARTAAVMAGMFGGAALVGRIVGGFLLDIYSAKIIGMISLLLPAVACVIYFMFPIGPAVAAIVAILFGLGVGAEGDVLGYVTSRFFGVRNFGTIYGVVSGAFALGAGVGPLAMSGMIDNFGSYELVVPLLFCALILCALLFVTLGSYPQADEPRQTPTNLRQSAEAG